ncbi:MAG TPA: Nramp family divalent metal transporter, partial [Rhodothermales bacterium]|nr:Nramp family divalent metal transporter [Rhodothermales bacterium]
KVSWLLWYWFAVILLVVSQNGGIVGGVGEALAIARPLTEEGAHYNQVQDQLVQAKVDLAVAARAGAGGSPAAAALSLRVDALTAQVTTLSEPVDILLWAAVVAVLTSIFMYYGRYQLIQVVSTSLVAIFTLVTVVVVILLQSTPWKITPQEFMSGLQFHIPPTRSGGTANGISTALATFGMIGLAAGELIMYPYWCMEKGYARWTGPRDDSPEWAQRARGWMRVLRYDVWLSMVVYTFATVAFYMLGAGVLSRTDLNPTDGQAMIRTLSQMYVPVFGRWAEGGFLIGAFAILYSTFFVFAAGFARIITDALVLLGLIESTEEVRVVWVRRLGVLLPILALIAFAFVRAPVAMVLASGLGQAIMMPMLGAVAVYFRYRRIDERLKPGAVWDLFLWLSFIGMFLIGAWSLYNAIV